jgi:hypothetical protein
LEQKDRFLVLRQAGSGPPHHGLGEFSGNFGNALVAHDGLPLALFVSRETFLTEILALASWKMYEDLDF